MKESRFKEEGKELSRQEEETRAKVLESEKERYFSKGATWHQGMTSGGKEVPQRRHGQQKFQAYRNLKTLFKRTAAENLRLTTT